MSAAIQVLELHTAMRRNRKRDGICLGIKKRRFGFSAGRNFGRLAPACGFDEQDRSGTQHCRVGNSDVFPVFGESAALSPVTATCAPEMNRKRHENRLVNFG